MSESVIQTFLTNVGSGLANYSGTETCTASTAPYYSHCGQNISAAQIIYDASQAYSINPQDILATLEKEQSLVTEPAPNPNDANAVADYQASLNCAMGYESCSSNYVGFFTQVDNGAWQLRYDYEMASGNSYWGYSPSSYSSICGSPTNLYSAGLYPGNTVTFADPWYQTDPFSTSVPETITIANAATAALYCYTPYVGPYSETGYSGSYNFVYYFQLWFGSTQATVAYQWAYEGQSAYIDSAMTIPFTSSVLNVAPGQDFYISLEARNVGYETWEQSNFHLGLSDPTSRTSPFYNSTWIDNNRPGGLSVSSVPPGGETTIDFTLQAPQQAGTYQEYYNLVADGITWLNDPGFNYTINVVVPRTPFNTQNTDLASGQSLGAGRHLLSSDSQSTLVVQDDGNLVLYSQQQPTWTSGTSSNSVSQLIMQLDGNLVLYNTGGQPIWASGTVSKPDDPGAWLALQTDGNLVIYSTSGTALWASNTVNVPPFIDMSDTTLSSNTLLYPNQFLETDDGNYQLLLQLDSNLVLYYQGQPIWASNTVGESAAFLVNQNDGNLVLYNSSGKPLWASNTNGKGPSLLIMQNDGNLVLYNSSGVATWNTATEGKTP